MGRVKVELQLPGVATSDAEELWYDTVRWPTFVDGFGHVHKVDAGWPRELGAVVVWDSKPGGRGRVLERVVSFEARVGQTVEVEDEKIFGTPDDRLRARRRRHHRDPRAGLRHQARPRRSCCSRLRLRPSPDARLAEAHPRALRARGAGARRSLTRKELSQKHVRVQGRRRRRRHHGRPDRADDRRRRVRRRPQGRQAGVRRRRPHRGPQRDRRSRSARLVKKEKLTEEQADAAGRRRSSGASTGTTSYEGFGDVDFVIEAVPEKMEIKQAVFAELDAVTPGHAILASNTSSLSITEIGDATLRPDKVVGFHYFYPASVMPLIEVIEGDDTSQETMQAAVNVRPGDQEAADHAAPRCPGFVVNRILNSGIARGLARPGGAGARRSRRSTRASAPPTSCRWGRTSWSTCSASTPCYHVAEHLHESYGDRFYVPKGMGKLVAAGQARRQDRRRRLLRQRGQPNLEGDADPTSTSSSSC